MEYLADKKETMPKQREFLKPGKNNNEDRMNFVNQKIPQYGILGCSRTSY